MKKLSTLVITLIFAVNILAGCSLNTSKEDRQIKSVTSDFLKAKANLGYKTITGLEGEKYVTKAAKKKIDEQAKQQTSVYKDVKGKSSIEGNPVFKIVKKDKNGADVESDFKLKVTSEVNPSANGTKNYKFKANLKKENGKWLVDTFGFSPQK